ncbi:uncharacterized protein EAF01_003606 [Botrytis porri]|uniref:uncharacterized protein n=1 Tax=Botrytis porri TaxID=87229 RepID=UPI001901BB02|nr:uncharacterized protein EAF01_003606 [Botrytis porri]KAF7909888.1 hypothetical protein EAF01_003606 [Botrytis porri]
MSTKIGKTFTSFRKLPLELRLAIWELARPAGRIIELNLLERSTIKEEWNVTQFPQAPHQSDDVENGDENPITYNRLWGFKSNTSIPALLLACRESHEVASKWYPRVFQCYADNPQTLRVPTAMQGPGSVSLPQTYFNFEEDTLFITPETFRPRYNAENDEISRRLDNLAGAPLSITTGVSRLVHDPDFLRIENLAIKLTSDEWTLYWDAHAEWLAQCLERGFRNLKTLTIVVDQHIPSPYWRETQGVKMSKEDRANLVYMDKLIDVQDACRFYHPDRPILEQEKTKWTKPKPNASYFTQKHIRKLTQHMMDIIRVEDLKAGKLMWDLPEIQFKIVLPAKIQKNLQRNKRLYKKEFAGWNREATSESEE